MAKKKREREGGRFKCACRVNKKHGPGNGHQNRIFCRSARNIMRVQFLEQIQNSVRPVCYKKKCERRAYFK